MTTYRNIHGRSIQAVTTDPTESVAEGQIWYNTTSDTFKSVIASEAWSSAAPTINLTNNGAGAGTQTAGLTFGGRNPPGPAFVSTTEEYNGSGWTAGGALNTARSYSAGFGTQTAGVAAGGRIDAPGTSTNATEEYDGSSWTTVNNMGTARRVGGSAGIVQTAGLAIGGGPPGVTTTEHYDGTNWTSGGALNTARFYLAGFGTLTSAVAAGGNGGESAVEEYNGSSWTSATSLGTGRTQLGSSGSSETDGIVFGGEAPGPTVKADAESYDGTSWTEGPNLATARRGLSGSSGHSKTAALATAGFPTYNLTEEFNKSANVITAGAYSAGPTLNANKTRGAGWGSMTSAVLAGGQNPGGLTNASSEFDGSSWTAGGSMNNARQELGALGATESAGIVFGGEPNPLGTAVESYNGSSWTTTTAFPTAMKFGRMHAGPSTAGIVSGGSTPTGSGGDDSNGNFHDSHDWDGSSWTANTDMPFANQGGSAGSQTATVQSGNGYLVSPSIRMLDWDGSSWTAGASAVSGTDSYMVVGTQAAFVMGTANPPRTLTQVGDGTTIATGPSFSVDKGAKSGIGSSTSLNGAGGGEPGPVNTFEEFTAGTSTLNVKTLTQS